MTPSEVRAKSRAEQIKLLEEKRRALFLLEMERRSGQLAKPSNRKEQRRDIARLLTVLREGEGKVKAKGKGHGTATKE